MPSVSMLQDMQFKSALNARRKIMTRLWLDVICRLSAVVAMNGYNREIGSRHEQCLMLLSLFPKFTKYRYQAIDGSRSQGHRLRLLRGVDSVSPN